MKNSLYLDNWPLLNAMGYMDGEQQKVFIQLRTVEHYKLKSDLYDESIDPDE